MPFEPNNNANPNGRPNGSVIAYQGFVQRAKYLMDRHTLGEIKAIAKNEAELNKLPVNDAKIIARIAEAVSPDGGQSMDRLLDRIIGKPVQPVAQKVEHSIGTDTLAAMKEIAQLTREDKLAIKQILDSRIIEQVPVQDD